MDADPRIELALDLTRQDLANQFTAVDELRARVGALIAAAAIATGLLSTQTFSETGGFPVGAWVAAVSSLLFVGVCAYILQPRTWQGDSVDTKRLFGLIDAGDYPTIDVMRRSIAEYTRAHYVENQVILAFLYRCFMMALILLVVDFGGWFAALTGS